MAPGPRSAAGAIAALLLIIAGCTGDQPVRPPQAAPPAVAPESFPDIPLPLGFVADAGADQLALALGDGSLRRLDLSLVHRGGGGPPPEAILDDLRRGLAANGWVQAADGSFTKGGERLLVQAGREDDRATLRLRLVPPPVAAR